MDSSAVRNALWELFEQQELGLLRYSDRGPGLEVFPPEADGDVVGDYRRALVRVSILADEIFENLEAYLAIHNDLYGGSITTRLRRVIPIPWMYRPIPYSAHLESLSRIAKALDTSRHAARQQAANYRGRPIAARAMLKLQKYVIALSPAVLALQRICAGLSERANGTRGASLAAYNAAVDEYQRLQQAYNQAGTELNLALKALKEAVPPPKSEAQGPP